MRMLFAAVHESAIGTRQASQLRHLVSANEPGHLSRVSAIGSHETLCND